MKTNLVKIGNSRGIRIPELLLRESEFDKKVELEVVDKREFRLIAISDKPVLPRFNDEYLLSLGALSDWNRPEEDEAWKSFQSVK